MYNILERLEHFKFNYDDDPKINYLKECAVVDVINRGLADLYDSQPKNPINFLANWLLVESNGKEIKKMIESENKIKSATKKTVELKKQKLEELIKHAEIEHKKAEDEKEFLLNKIKNCSNFEMNLNDLCDGIQKTTNSTGVYFGIYDKKRKAVKIDDDESAHLTNIQVIRYIGFCGDHDFLKFKSLDANAGVTYELFAPKSQTNNKGKNSKENEDDENAESEEAAKKAKSLSDEDAAKKLENEIFSDCNYILVDEVVRNSKINYFREPRLGCFLAIEIAINSSLSSTSLNSAIENLTTFNTKMREYEARKEEYLKSAQDDDNPKEGNNSNKPKNAEADSEKGKTIEANKDNSGEAQNHIQNSSMEQQNNLNVSNSNKLNSSGANAQNASADPNNNSNLNNANMEENNENNFPEENIVLEDYVMTEKKYVLCLDTLGQDRVFDLEEKKFIFEISRIFKKSWEELEKTLLIKDRDLRIEQIEKEKGLKEAAYVEKLENDEEGFVKESMQDEKYATIEDAAEKAVYSQLFKARFLIYSIQQEPQMLELFKLISQYEFLEFEKLVQSIFYFVGFENTEINEINTNKLDWTLAKQNWNASILNILIEYNPFGPKGKLASYKMLHKFLAYLETMDKEALRQYNFVLARIADYLQLILTIRRNDILRRREIINNKILEREELIKEKALRDERRVVEFEEYKKGFENLENPEDAKNFDENAWLENWDSQNKEIVIPPEVVLDVDDDFIVD